MDESASPCACRRKVATPARRSAARNPGSAPRPCRRGSDSLRRNGSIQKQSPAGLRQWGFVFEYWWRRRESPTSTICSVNSLILLSIRPGVAHKTHTTWGANLGFYQPVIYVGAGFYCDRCKVSPILTDCMRSLELLQKQLRTYFDSGSSFSH